MRPVGVRRREVRLAVRRRHGAPAREVRGGVGHGRRRREGERDVRRAVRVGHGRRGRALARAPRADGGVRRGTRACGERRGGEGRPRGRGVALLRAEQHVDGDVVESIRGAARQPRQQRLPRRDDRGRAPRARLHGAERVERRAERARETARLEALRPGNAPGTLGDWVPLRAHPPPHAEGAGGRDRVRMGRHVPRDMGLAGRLPLRAFARRERRPSHCYEGPGAGAEGAPSPTPPAAARAVERDDLSACALHVPRRALVPGRVQPRPGPRLQGPSPRPLERLVEGVRRSEDAVLPRADRAVRLRDEGGQRRRLRLRHLGGRGGVCAREPVRGHGDDRGRGRARQHPPRRQAHGGAAPRGARAQPHVRTQGRAVRQSVAQVLRSEGRHGDADLRPRGKLGDARP